jgi:hypothetical protein
MTVVLWAIAAFLSIIGLIASAIWIYSDLVKPEVDVSIYFAKFSLLIPMSVAVGFTSFNFNRERKLLEEYAFKATVGLALNSYHDILKNECPESEISKVTDFMVETMANIFSSPLENIAKQPKDEIEKSVYEKVMKGFGHFIPKPPK